MFQLLYEICNTSQNHFSPNQSKSNLDKLGIKFSIPKVMPEYSENPSPFPQKNKQLRKFKLPLN